MQWIINLVARILGFRVLTREERAILWVRATMFAARRARTTAEDQYAAFRERWLADRSDRNREAVEMAWETLQDAERGCQAAERIVAEHRRKLWRGEYRATA